jgi:hypothetical protein
LCPNAGRCAAVTTRDTAGQPLTLTNYAVHFADLAELDHPPAAEAPAVLADVLTRATRRPARRATLADELALAESACMCPPPLLRPRAALPTHPPRPPVFTDRARA